jgi:hypothetical protein
MNYGISIIALGHNYYGQLAFNLALSLKANDPLIKIALLHDTGAISTLKPWHTVFFDKMIQLPEETYIQDEIRQYQKAKLYVDKYTPFDYTIYLDADTLWIPGRRASWMFGECMCFDFSIQTNAIYNVETKKISSNRYLFWGNPEEICNYYNIKTGVLPQTMSTFFYFNKQDPGVQKLFIKMREIYADPKAPCKQWANGKPDEFCFNVACATENCIPPLLHYRPIYFSETEDVKPKEEIFKYFWAITNGGNKTRPAIIDIYNQLLNQYCKQMKVPDRFYHIDKKDILIERKNW